MRFALRVLVCLVICSCAAHAQKVEKPSIEARVHTYVRTHKELLTNDALLSSAIFADAGSTIHCQNVGGPSCVETDPLLGKHPSAGAVIGLAIGADVGFIAINHLVWHFAPDKVSRHILWVWTAPVILTEALASQNNVNVTEMLENELTKQRSQARARLAHD